MPTKNNSSNLVGFLAISFGIFLIISGVMVELDNLLRSLIMAAGFFSLVYGIIGYRS